MNWIKTTKEVFEEYGKTVDNNFRRLSDGEYAQHFEQTGTMFVLSRFDKRVEQMTNEAFNTYLEWTEPTEE